MLNTLQKYVSGWYLKGIQVEGFEISLKQSAVMTGNQDSSDVGFRMVCSGNAPSQSKPGKMALCPTAQLCDRT